MIPTQAVVEDIVEQFLKVHPKDIVQVDSEEDVDKLVEGSQNRLKVIWITEGVDDPVYAFWRLFKAEMLAPTSYFIFTGAKDYPSWRDLTIYYAGVKFGSLFLMVCDSNTSPSIVPSQRGLFSR